MRRPLRAKHRAEHNRRLFTEASLAGGDGFCLQDRVGSLTGLSHFLRVELCREKAKGFYSIVISATTISPASFLSKQAARSSWRPVFSSLIGPA